MTNCPNCGAPVDPHAEACAYCDTPYMRRETKIEINQTADAISFSAYSFMVGPDGKVAMRETH